MINTPIIGKAVKGEFIPKDPALQKRTLFRHEGKDVVQTFKRYDPKRTPSQNKYLHVCFVCTAEALTESQGRVFTPDEAKGIVKDMRLRVFENGFWRVRGTRELSKEETSNLIDWLREWVLNTFNYYIPSSEEAVQAGLVV